MRYFTLIFCSFLLACNSNSDNGSEYIQEIEFVEDMEIVPDSILTIHGAMDEMDGYFYFYVGGEIEDQEALKEVHIVPEVWEGYDSTDVQEWMQGMAGYNFDLTDELPFFSGEVKVYFDATKKVLATSYKVLDGYPDGNVILYNPKQEKVVERKYEMYDLASVSRDVYAVMWSLEKSKSNLFIEYPENYMVDVNDSTKELVLGPSVNFEPGSDNTLMDIVDKKTFLNPFRINNEVYSGRLSGYNPFVGFPMSQYFELNFKNGWLHDTIRIWNDWGELQLEELFVNGELVETIYVQDEEYGDGMAKPIIYCYPEKTTPLNVQIKIDGRLTHTYPTYPNKGWNVIAEPDGTLKDENGKTYYALFWEGEGNHEFTYPDGFVIEGSKTTDFFEKTLPILGLNAKEQNEFIIYWLPLMEKNPYNLIRFASTEYEKNTALIVTPTPDTYIRVMMVWSPLKEPVSIPMQDLTELSAVRKGFTVVEWGGKKQDFISLP